MSAQDFLVELGTEELPPKAPTTWPCVLAGIEKPAKRWLEVERKRPRRATCLAVLLTA